ncbi:MAG: ATP-binding cassette domain-containing protein [Chloroflexi bacterium]|nr:ATP-binding cassette domain-containing protein [Chloroflexota bacterium]
MTERPSSCIIQPPLLVATGIVRRFGRTLALRGVSLNIMPCECVALLGPNGAGKTTLVRVLATALQPSAGALTIGGVDALRDAARARPLVGAVGHETHLYQDLTARENLRFYGRLYGVRGLEDRVSTVLKESDIAAVADRPVRTLSRGMQQRVALGRAILHEPMLLLLDEPETGLDDTAQRRLARMLEDWTDRGRAVVLTSHRLEWTRRLADRAIVLREGQIVAHIDRSDLEPDIVAAAYSGALSSAG